MTGFQFEGASSSSHCLRFSLSFFFSLLSKFRGFPQLKEGKKQEVAISCDLNPKTRSHAASASAKSPRCQRPMGRHLSCFPRRPRCTQRDHDQHRDWKKRKSRKTQGFVGFILHNHKKINNQPPFTPPFFGPIDPPPHSKTNNALPLGFSVFIPNWPATHPTSERDRKTITTTTEKVPLRPKDKGPAPSQKEARRAWYRMGCCPYGQVDRPDQVRRDDRLSPQPLSLHALAACHKHWNT